MWGGGDQGVVGCVLLWEYLCLGCVWQVRCACGVRDVLTWCVCVCGCVVVSACVCACVCVVVCVCVCVRGSP